MKQLNPNAIGLSAGILSGVCMLIMGVLAIFGVYMEAFELMKVWHIWFDATVLGVIAGVIEAFVLSYVGGYLFGWLYNAFSK
jgi:hypothetical protein